MINQKIQDLEKEINSPSFISNTMEYIVRTEAKLETLEEVKKEIEDKIKLWEFKVIEDPNNYLTKEQINFINFIVREELKSLLGEK